MTEISWGGSSNINSELEWWQMEGKVGYKITWLQGTWVIITLIACGSHWKQTLSVGMMPLPGIKFSWISLSLGIHGNTSSKRRKGWSEIKSERGKSESRGDFVWPGSAFLAIIEPFENGENNIELGHVWPGLQLLPAFAGRFWTVMSFGSKPGLYSARTYLYLIFQVPPLCIWWHRCNASHNPWTITPNNSIYTPNIYTWFLLIPTFSFILY